MKKQPYVRESIQTLINFTLILSGCFIAISLSTTLGQTGDWGMLASGIIVSFLEIISKRIYKIQNIILTLPRNKKSSIIKHFTIMLNDIKLGILYGFFIEAFKLGS